ncbi:MAG TPA: ATP-binding cassette domain-containing protein [Bacteroidales bacterium]|nr:ATP-binding cassette domain-containing protein [Bacteroidales bacterium]HPS49990.1 ATP-binding cassette domain-containing protein [Bacteroidales bacterium]
MSEPILMALVQLFAIVAASVNKQISENSRKILESYLSQHLNNQELEEYLKLFDELLMFHLPEQPEMDPTEVYDKTKAICNRIKNNLTAQDRIIVFIKFLEFLTALTRENSPRPVTDDQNLDTYLTIFRAAFTFPELEFNDAVAFITDPDGGKINPEHLLTIRGEMTSPEPAGKYIYRERLDGRVLVLFVPSVRTLICRYLGSDELYLNGHIIQPYRSFVLTNGTILKNLKIAPVYYADVASRFFHASRKIQIDFTAKEISYRFKKSTNGIHPFSLTATSGELIGVMGGSGVGKSTLLNVLNGNLKLNDGQILINGFDLEKDHDALQGMIGFVPQDDLLIDELTVFQNLYYNAKLCFRDFSEKKIIRAVMRVLMDIDLISIRNLTVGDPLNKFISGGQRKRLNIALELIREPAVLFADEPTSGLSSMDSEMVMLLLKEQTLKGRLVIVNIHQPSSDIYKLFDKLLIMDKGGYPIYYGNPIDALTYFKLAGNHVNPDESECQSCGYVNPEQLLQITEAKIVNEYGRFTGNRKTTPKEWYESFRKNIQPSLKLKEEKKEIPKSHFKIPGKIKQFRIFSIRNLLTKITNRQYMLINLLEAPFLAALLAYLTRYSFGEQYIFGDNRNLVPYLFMSVVVSLFLGMMVSAEEIIRDRRILKREAFLNLSRFSYLNSKIILLFALSAIQAFLYVVVGNWIMGIHGMTLSYWLILFATSCCANLIGLNISSGLNSVVAIYILIPFIIVPQLLLSGTVVPFDYLNPSIASRKHVPLVGNMMTSRWTFEALAVEQFRNNKYEKIFYPYDKEISRYSYITALEIPTLKSELDVCLRNLIKKENPAQTANYFKILKTEIPGLLKESGYSAFPAFDSLTEKLLTDGAVQNAKAYLDSLSLFFSSQMQVVTSKRDAAYEKLAKKMGEEGVYAFKQKYYNENLADLLLNKTAENKIIEGKGFLIRKKDPVFMEPESKSGQAHFYAPVKIIGSLKINTFWFDFAVIWLMSALLYLTLLHDTLRKAIEYSSRIHFRLPRMMTRKSKS